MDTVPFYAPGSASVTFTAVHCISHCTRLLTFQYADQYREELFHAPVAHPGRTAVLAGPNSSLAPGARLDLSGAGGGAPTGTQPAGRWN